MNIIEKILNQVEAITEEDIKSWIIVDILELYKPRINYWSCINLTTFPYRVGLVLQKLSIALNDFLWIQASFYKDLICRWGIHYVQN